MRTATTTPIFYLFFINFRKIDRKFDPSPIDPARAVGPGRTYGYTAPGAGSVSPGAAPVCCCPAGHPHSTRSRVALTRAAPPVWPRQCGCWRDAAGARKISDSDVRSGRPGSRLRSHACPHCRRCSLGVRPHSSQESHEPAVRLP
jgi:hypothetical protein